jgi:hypothetical protein
MQVISYKKNEQGQLVVTLDLASSTGSSFLQKEEDLAILLNEVGRLATQDLLDTSDESGQKLQLGAEVYYPKQVQKKR